MPTEAEALPSGALFAALKDRSSTSQLSPNVLEIVEPFFAEEPFGGTDCAFGEAAAGLGVVAEIDAIARRLKDDFVQAHDFAFAE